MSIIPSYITDEIILLTQTLQEKIRTLPIDTKIIIDSDDCQYLANNIRSDTEVPIEPSLTELERKVTYGMLQAVMIGETMQRPPTYAACAYSISLYEDMLKAKQYSSTAIYYEMGRLLSEVTHGMNKKRRNGKAYKFVDNINSKNSKQKAMAAIRIYEYFKDHPSSLIYKKLDDCFLPSIIGRIKEDDHNSLKTKIEQLFNVTNHIFA
jgi:hypothetical protein